MRAAELAEPYPVVNAGTSALVAARLLADKRLPGLVVVDADGAPSAVLPASQVVRFIVPTYVQDEPSLAGVLDEQAADRIAERLSGSTVGQLMPDKPPALAVVHADDTVLELAAAMARLRSPVCAVVDGGRVVGAVTASHLLEFVCSKVG